MGWRLTEEKIKELLSESFLRILGGRSGFACTRPEADYGVDLTVDRIIAVQEGQRMRYRQNGESIHFQLKCTTEAGVERQDDLVRYDLAVKNYNDLVERRDAVPPLYLLLYVIPQAQAEWVLDEQAAARLVLRGQGYWFCPEAGATQSVNQHTVRIHIPAANRASLEMIPEMFATVYG